MDYIASTILIGVGATAIMDLWGETRARLMNIPAPNYGLVGRWIAYIPRGRFIHSPIAATAPIMGERLIGWASHYLIGITFAALLIGIWGLGWVQDPSIGPALAVGIGTVLAPFLLMQPGMGAGLFARRLPKPSSARIQSLITHTVFGLGLYVTGMAVSFVSTT
jgi:hypothetical protein